MLRPVAKTEPVRYSSLGSNNQQHTVTPGDTLSKIAGDNNMSLSALLAANPQITNPNAISVGQVINLQAETDTSSGGPSTTQPVYTGPGSSPGTGGLPEAVSTPVYTGPGSSPGTGGLPENNATEDRASNANSSHIVVAGDSLSKIAGDNNMSLSALLAANPQITNPNVISVGQVINLQAETDTNSGRRSTTQTVYTGPGSSPGTGGLPTDRSADAGNKHTVVSGDSLSRVAGDNNVTLEALIAANPQITNPNAISVGQVIKIPTTDEVDTDTNSDQIYTGPGSSPGTGGLPDPAPAPEYTGPGSSPGTGGLPLTPVPVYTGRGSSPGTGGLPDPAPSPEYTGPGSSPGTGGLPPAPVPEYTGPGSSPGTGGLSAVDRAKALRNDLPERENVNAEDLLATGNYDDHFTRGTDLNLRQAELKANDFNGGDNHIVTQSIFDPVVSGKNTTIDEYSVTAVLPDGVDPRELLARMAADMDETLGGEFQDLGDFKNQGDTPEVGQIIDIDVKDGPRLPLLGWKVPLVESPFNAPVIISHMDDSSFSVQTIEYNNQEHLLHGTREWGFEENADGSVKFYTRGTSVEDIKAAEGIRFIPGANAKDGEFRYWSAWTDGVERELEAVDAGIVNKETIQKSGPTGIDIYRSLTVDQQHIIRDAQIDSHEREAGRLEDEADSLFVQNPLESNGPYTDDPFYDPYSEAPYASHLNHLAAEHRDEAEDWQQRRLRARSDD